MSDDEIENIEVGFDPAGEADSTTFMVRISAQGGQDLSEAIDQLKAISFRPPSVSSQIRGMPHRESALASGLIPARPEWSRVNYPAESDVSLRERLLQDLARRARLERDNLHFSLGHGSRLSELVSPEPKTDDSDFSIVQIHSKAEAIAHGKHCGWCTGIPYKKDYERRYQYGKLYVLYRLKDGKAKRRSSYQLFVSNCGSVEFQKKGCKNLDARTFAEGLSNAELKKQFLEILPSPFHNMGNSFQTAAESMRISMRSRQMGRMSGFVEALGAHHVEAGDFQSLLEESSLMTEETRLQKKSYKARTKFDQLAQSRMARS